MQSENWEEVKNNILLDDDSDNSEMKRKYLVVVIYDIIDNKKRNKMASLLKGYGFRVQRSCFECILNISLYHRLIDEIEMCVSAEDLVRVYRLTGNMDVKTWGSLGKLYDEDFLII